MSTTDALTAPDQDVRDRIVAARGVSLTVEAGAGTGKTTLLVDRVVSRLRSGTPLPRLAVITFTRKAASELVARIRKVLVEHRGRNEEWAALAFDDFDRASIGTTDSFCRSILADFPLEAGVAPGFALVDETAQPALQDLAWTRFLERSDRSERMLSRLREAGVKTPTLREVADAILSNPDLTVPAATEEAGPDPIEAFGEAFRAVWDLRDRCRDEKDALARRLAELDENLRVARAIGGAAGARVLVPRGRDGRRLKLANRKLGQAPAWGGAGNKATMIEALEQLDEVVDAALARHGGALASDVARWLGEYVEEYARLKRERGLLDFRDLALRTRDLLRRSPSVRRRIAARFDEILIDEVQDTDPLQMEIALLLAARGDVPPNVLDAALEPGRLFLVGDPKQSIYRFRRADIELYESVRERVRDDALPPLQANFRSHPGILRFVNAVFSGWMEPPEGARWQARYVDLLPARTGGDADEAPRVSLLLPDPAFEAAVSAGGGGRLRASERGEIEVDAVARAIRRLLGLDGSPAATVVDPDSRETRPARPRDVAVIVRKIEWGDRLLDRLRRVGVPAGVAGGRRFWAQEEIRTLIALLEAVVDPENRLARFAALRSPAFGLPDDELVLHFLEEDGDDSSETSPAVADALARLRDLGTTARTTSIPDFLEQLAEELTLLSVFGFRPDGRGRIESLRILLEAADSLVEAGFDSLPAFVRWLKEQSGESRGEGLGESDPGEEGGVQILTIHKAKGLEFPIVVLADLAGKAPTRESVVSDRAAGRIEFRLSKPGAIASPGFEAAFRAERLRQRAEEVRLLYVAMTRARDRLLLSWPSATGGFLERGETSELAGRIGCAPGAPAPRDSGLATIFAGDLPPLEDSGRILSFDPARVAPAPLPDPEGRVAARRRARRGVRVMAATRLRPPDDSGPAPWADLPLFAPGPGGPEFGSLVHQALARWDPGSADPGRAALEAAVALAESRITRERGRTFRFGETEVEEAARLLERVTADPAVSVIWKSPRVRREVPFLLPIAEDFLSGTIDVLVDEPDGTLSIVDYKTDRLGLRSGEEAKERYRTQALAYAHAATRITGRAVREVRFLFLSARPVEIGSFPVDEDFGRQARALIGAARGI